MKKINKMLFRDMKIYQFQMIAVVLIIFFGITLFSACVMSYKNLQVFKNDFYSKNNFLDAYVDGENLETKDIEAIKKIQGVSDAEGRFELEGGVTLNNGSNGTVKVIAYASYLPKINQLRFVSGQYFSSNTQILVSRNFATFNKFNLGKTLTLKLLGKKIPVTVQGIVESPEFIITIKSRDYVMPSVEDYGIVYISNEILDQNFGISRTSFNQIHLKFDKNVNITTLKKNIEDNLKEKFVYFTERKDQISEVMAREDIGMISEIAYMFPIMFLAAAALVIFVVQKKLIDLQRSRIGVLKALGYNNRKIISYYLKQSFLLATTGSLLSVMPSYFMSIYITQIYCKLVYIPISSFKFDWYVIGVAILLSNIFAIGATVLTVQALLKITAAEAMTSIKITDFDENNPIIKLGKNFKFDNKLVIRNVFRNPTRSIFTIFCYMIAFTLFSAPIFLNDSVKYAENNQFENIQDYDYKIIFHQPLTTEKIDGLIAEYNLQNVSPFLEFPIEINSLTGKKTLRMIGVTKDYQINDGNKTLSPSDKGIVLPKAIMKQLGVAKGDDLTTKFITQNNKKLNLKVFDSFEQYVGFSAYIEINELKNILNMTENSNGLYLIDKQNNFKSKQREIEENEFVKRIDSVKQERTEFNTLLKLINIFIIVMIIFGLLMGFSSIYNATIINVIDRKREWGTLKILGYSNARILMMSFKETSICFILSLIPSALISIAVCYILGILMSNDFYTSPFVINDRLLLYPTILGTIISLVSLLIYANNIKNIDSSEIIKIKE